jgi:dTDP-4-amino-4,6-dideoxygalactose transaminase
MIGESMGLDTRRVPLLDLATLHRPIEAELRAAVDEVLQSQQFILGPPVSGLEKEVAEYCRVSHAVGCGSGTDALLLALLALGIGPGDEVAVPAFTFFATAGAVSSAGATPVFVDIDPRTYNLDPARLAELAVTRPRLRALIAVHLFGGVADMDPILALAGKHQLAVIEDGAQAIGAEYRGRRALSIGTIGCLSFFPTKNLGGMGDGGMLTTRDAGLAAKLAALRVHGSTQRYRHDWIGMNSRLDSLQAAVLRVKLRYLDQWTTQRQTHAASYRRLLGEAGVPLGLPSPAPYQSRHVFNQFVVRCRNRDALRLHLAELGIGTEVYYPSTLPQQPCYHHLGHRSEEFPESERAAAEVLALPIHPALAEDDIVYVCKAISGFFHSAR